MNSYKVLGLIPARAGSKGVPGKNKKLLAGKPLIQYTAEAALAAARLTKTIVSTDDSDVADICRGLGIEVPFMRPEELAQDKTPTLPAVQHALNFLKERGEVYDAVCLLQPTNPLRRSEDIDNCIEMLFEQKLDSVISIVPVPHEYSPHLMYFMDDEAMLQLVTGGGEPSANRQSAPKAFRREGTVYVTRTDTVLNENSLYGKRIGGYKIELTESINIDTMEDWAKAEKYFNSFR